MIRKQLVFPLIKEICLEENIKFLEESSRGMYGVLIFDNGKKFYLKDINFNLNFVSSVRITKNKALTTFFLDLFGYKVPEYTMVYTSEKCKRYGLLDNLDKGIEFAASIGYPVILKINDSSKGRGIYKAYNEKELLDSANSLFQITNTFQIQKYYSYSDYRVVVLGNEILSAYERRPLYIIGDGINTIKQLLLLKQEYYVRSGRDTSIDLEDIDLKNNLDRLGYTFDSVLKYGEQCVLRNISNLSAGGECIELTDKIHRDYAKLCIKIAQDLNLNLCGIDIMCRNICMDIDDYIILEVNSAPGLDNYAFCGEEQERYVKELYRKIILYVKDQLV